MSFLKQLLSPFVEFEDNKNREQPRENQSPVSTSIPVQSPVQPVTPPIDINAHHPLIEAPEVATTTASQVPSYSPTGTLSQPLPEHTEYFENLLNEANAKNPVFQGTDYKEFVDSKFDIDAIQDEAIKYRTAFNVLKSTGLTKEKLVSTGQEYLNIIGRDMNAFQGAHTMKYQKEVRQKEQLIQKKAEELQALMERFNALKTDINHLTQDMNLTKDKLNILKTSYLLAGENKQKEIQTELQKIMQYF